MKTLEELKKELDAARAAEVAAEDALAAAKDAWYAVWDVYNEKLKETQDKGRD